MNGFALGGAFEGAQEAQKTAIQQQQVNQQGSYQTKLLQLDQQRLQNEQQRDLFARADKDLASLGTAVQQTLEAGKLNGKDNQTLSRIVQPLVQQYKRLATSAGRDPSAIDAQVAAVLANATVNLSTGGAAPGGTAKPAAGATPGPAAPAAPADVGGGTPAPPGQNLTGPDTTITGIDYGPVEYRNDKGQPVASPPAAGTNEVDHWTRVLATLPSFATPGMQDAVKVRLANAIKQNTPDATVHFMKTEDGNEVPLVITKQNGKATVTDTNGNPYVMPTGESGTDSEAIADAIISGKQPPVLTGLYRNAKGIRAKLAKKGFDLTNATLEWKAAEKQIQSLNGPQMVRYAGLAGSVVNTIDEVKSLAKQMQNSGVTALNAAKIQTLINTAGNTNLGKLATRYQAAVNTLKEEFANLANGGYAPTEPAWALANQQINGNYGVDQLTAGLEEVQRLIRYRLNAIPNFKTVGAGGPNRFINGGQAADTGHPPASGGASSVPPPPPGFVVMSPGR